MLDFLIYCVFVGALGLSLVVAGGGSSPVVVRERLLAGASPGSGAQTLGHVGSGAALLALEHRLSLGHVGSGAQAQ